MSIRLRLTLWYSTILAATLLIFGVSLYFITSYIMIDSQKERISEYVRSIGPSLAARFNPWTGTFEFPDIDRVKYSGLFPQLVDLNGNVISSVERGMEFTFSKQRILDRESYFSKQHVTTTRGEQGTSAQGATFLVLNVPVVKDRSVSYVLQVGVSLEDINAILDTLKLVLLLLALITILLAATFGWFMARKSLQPIEEVIHAASQIEKGSDLGRRIQYQGPRDEIGRLIETVNSMLGRMQTAYKELEESNRAQRRFVSDASHELRTPLTTIRGNVELLEKIWSQSGGDQPSMLSEQEKVQMTLESLGDISGEAARMSRLVNDLLALARADAGHEMRKEPVELLPLVEEVTRKAQHLPRKASWEVGSLEPLAGVRVLGDKDYLEQLLFIFIENAFKYTEEGSVRLDTLVSDGQAGFRISDTGIGMDKDEVPHIFDRFYRADISRGITAGTGLGLSIAKWIIDEHGGSVEVLTRKGKGTTFTIWLPILYDEPPNQV